MFVLLSETLTKLNSMLKVGFGFSIASEDFYHMYDTVLFNLTQLKS